MGPSVPGIETRWRIWISPMIRSATMINVALSPGSITKTRSTTQNDPRVIWESLSHSVITVEAKAREREALFLGIQ